MLQRWGKVRTLSRYLHHRPTSDHGCRYFVCLGAFVRCLRYCVANVPALALPPPTGTEAVPSGPSGVLHTSGAWCVVVSTGFVSTSYAVQSSPCTRKTRQNGAFRVSRASFVPEVAPRGSCRASVAAAFGTVTRPRNTQRHCGRPVPCIAAGVRLVLLTLR